MKVTMHLVACAIVALGAPCLLAETLSTESFDYPAGQPLAGQSGGSGWGANAWTASSRYSIVSGLSFSDLSVSGNAVQINYPNSTNSQEVANRKVASTANPSTLWVSYLYRPDTVVNNHYNGLQVNASTSNVGAAVLRVANRGWSTNNGGVGVDNSIAFGSQPYVDGTTYLAIAKFSGLNTTTVTGKRWLLTEADYDALKIDGLTEAELNLNALTLDYATETVTFGSPLAFDTNKYVQLQFVTSTGTSQAVTYDEISHATDINDLFPVPEPATMAMLALAAGGLAGYARRRGRRA